jgi:hypothetical protein
MKKIYLLFLMVCVGVISNAATKTWIGASGGAWSVGTNWSGGVPTSIDDVVFNTSVTVVVDGVITVNSLVITNNSAVVFQGIGTTAAARAFTLNCPSCISSIDAGSELTITGTLNTSGIDLTLANTAIFNVNGILNLGTAAYTGTSRLLPVTGTVTTINGTLNVVGSGTSVSGSAIATYIVNGIQEMKRNGGIFPVATYATTARNIISGAVATIPTFTSSQTTTWGTIEFNAPANTNVGASGAALFSAASVICQDFKVINTGTGNCTISASGSAARIITVNGDLSVAAGAVCNINSTVAAVNATASGFDVKGNVTIDGTVTETGSATASKITMINITPKNISVNGTISNDVSLIINSTGGVTALTDITLPNSSNAKLTFTVGNLDMLTNNKLLFIQNPATLACITGTATSHLIGKMKRNTNLIGGYHFPVSNNATDIPKCLITPDAAGASDFTVEFIGTNPNKSTGLTPGTIDEVGNYVWDITRNAVGPTATISLGYGGYAANTVATPATAKVLHWNNTLLVWEDKGGNVDVVPAGINAITSNAGCNDFSPYSIGGPVGTLPVTINYLNGTKQNGSHNLNWKVSCTSSQNVTLSIERSADGRNFKAINSITADGIRCLQPFSYADNSPLPGNNYYRLKMVDENGKITYSTIVLIINKETGFDIAGILPSLINNNTAVLNTSAAKKMQLTVVVTDMLGKQVEQVQYNLIAGSNQIPLNFTNLAAGTYQLVGYTTEGKSKTIRFVKQ